MLQRVLKQCFRPPLRKVWERAHPITGPYKDTTTEAGLPEGRPAAWIDSK